MMLRSSSTPVLGSLLSSFSDSPNNNNYHHDTNSSNVKHQQSLSRSPYHPKWCLNLTTSCNSFPISPSSAEFSENSYKGIRRAQSEGNLDGLAYASCNRNEEYFSSSQPKKIPGRGRDKCLMLETIPSFSFYNSRTRYEDDDDDDDDDDEHEKETDVNDEEENEQIKGNDKAMGDGQFRLHDKMKNMVLSEEVRVMDRISNVDIDAEKGFIGKEMFLARGRGIDGGANNFSCGGSDGGSGVGGGGGGDFNSADGDGGEMHDTEEYYKKMVQENPGNPLFLRNYAKFLYQTKQDPQRAEEFFSRAILADPKDGEILSQYAKLVWELHHDQDRASSYFERAVQASPEDSHVHAAYASFLWEIEEDEGECSILNDFHATPHNFREGAIASAGS